MVTRLEDGSANKNRIRQVRRDVWISHGDSHFLVGPQIASVGNDPRRVQLVLRDLLRGGSHGLASELSRMNRSESRRRNFLDE